MSADESAIRAEAVAWAIRSHDESFDDWEALADWLAADPAHAVHYDRATIAADEGADLPALAANDEAADPEVTPHKHGASWIPFAMAASIVAAVGGGWALRHAGRPDHVQIATRAGEVREISLGSGVRVTLGGATSLTFDRKDGRSARLDRGEALFTVTHDAAHPFRLDTGDATITDIGTLFDVERGNGATTVEVAEGKVRVAVPGNAIDADAGQQVSIDLARSELARRPQDPTLVGGWRDGRIDFDDMPLAELAVRLQRATGLAMTVAPGLRDRRASGSILVRRDPTVVRQQLAQMLDIGIDQQGAEWLWHERAGADTR